MESASGLMYDGQDATDNLEASDHNADIQLRGALVERALDSSLPDMVTEVSAKNRVQSIELDKLKALIDETKARNNEKQENKGNLDVDLGKLVREITLLELTIAELKSRVDLVQSDISSIVTKTYETKRGLADAERLKYTLEGTIKCYNLKMSSFEERIQLVEADSPVQEDILSTVCLIENCKDKIQELQAKKTFKDTKEQLTASSKLCSKETNEIRKLILKQQRCVRSECDKQRALQQSIDVLHKRNAAQLVRLQRQIVDASSRFKNWVQQSTQLENSIGKLKEQLGN